MYASSNHPARANERSNEQYICSVKHVAIMIMLATLIKTMPVGNLYHVMAIISISTACTTSIFIHHSKDHTPLAHLATACTHPVIKIHTQHVMDHSEIPANLDDLLLPSTVQLKCLCITHYLSHILIKALAGPHTLNS
jgi:hypothetical protein